ncbi:MULTISPECIES: hypothetical protein [Segatella]|jgi:hypothetical protein|uniref:Uncharacterized protein n=1 Tax=Segatella baroniae B14 TaxID=752555 RepID=D8DZK4_9BACT|nr:MULTISPECIES: hypothetical protein [Segatella]EFI71089.1 conserved hypothetical protein [Segatella baroniae B14]MDR4930591.1 hypothetical protein [Segatella bryantii]SDL60104.1 hypothetical protein SAMN04487899_103139 [Segatella bryantii]SDZ98452.1 hypothetical protein SAMN05216455_102154 [Segatella bryantii]SEP69426.1 hypothetical protein SAMN05444375_102112 [Segatella baroniae B14]
MKKFTLDEMKPSDLTIRIIKQFAHTYRVVRMNNGERVSCLN